MSGGRGTLGEALGRTAKMLVGMKKGVPGREQHEQRPGGSTEPQTVLAAGMRANGMM